MKFVGRATAARVVRTVMVFTHVSGEKPPIAPMFRSPVAGVDIVPAPLFFPRGGAGPVRTSSGLACFVQLDAGTLIAPACRGAVFDVG